MAFTHDGKTLVWNEGHWEVDGVEVSEPAQMLWVTNRPWKVLASALGKEGSHLPFTEIVLEGLRNPRTAARTVAWVKEALNSTLMSWDVTVALQAASIDTGLDEEARTLALGLYQDIVSPKVERMTREEMKAFVLGWVDGKIMTSAQVPDNILTMVFMPLVLGALQIPHYAFPLAPENPLPPEEPEWPGFPREPEWPGFPDPPSVLTVQEEKIRDLEFEIRWHRAPPEALDHYKEAVEAENAQRMREHEATLVKVREDYEKEKAAWTRKCRRIERKYRKMLQEHDAKISTWDKDHEEEIQTYQDWERNLEAQKKAYYDQIGVLWEWMDQAGPRGINGFPMFFSMRMMHMEDWKMCHKAILKEVARRESLGDLFGEES